MTVLEQISQYLQDHRADILRDLGTVVAIPSVLADAQPGAPFGSENARCLKAIAQLYRQNGFEMTVYEDGGYALAHVGPEDAEAIGIFGHADVVPVTPEDWIHTTPFEMIEKEGALFGRGVSDDKSAIIASLYLLRAFRDLNIPFKHKLTVYAGSNEESGMLDVKAYAKEHPLPVVSLIPDGGFPFSLGERGILRLNLNFDAPMEDILELHGGQNYNTVMPSLRCALRRTAELEAWTDAQQREWLTVEKTDEAILLTVNGVSAHAASPYLGISALKRLSNLLLGCEALCAADHQKLMTIAHAIETYDGVNLGISDTDPILGTLTAANGMVWMKDGCITFTIDVRFGTTITSETVVENVRRAVAANGVTVDVIYDAPAILLDAEAPASKALLRAYREASGDEQSQCFYMNGGTYCKYLPNAYAVGVQLGATAIKATLPQGHGNAHQADECMGVDNYLKGITILAHMLMKLDQEM